MEEYEAVPERVIKNKMKKHMDGKNTPGSAKTHELLKKLAAKYSKRGNNNEPVYDLKTMKTVQ